MLVVTGCFTVGSPPPGRGFAAAGSAVDAAATAAVATVAPLRNHRRGNFVIGFSALLVHLVDRLRPLLLAAHRAPTVGKPLVGSKGPPGGPIVELGCRSWRRARGGEYSRAPR